MNIHARSLPTRRIAVFSGCDQIGDGLFKIPFLRGLRAAFPDAEICWVTTGASVYGGVLKEFTAGYIDRVIQNSGLAASNFEAFRPKRLALGPIDIAIDTQTVVMRSLAVRRALRPEIFISAAADYFFSDVRPSQIGVAATSKPRHLVDHLMLLLALATRGTPPLDLGQPAIPERFSEFAATLLPAGKSYVGFAPGSGDVSKRWPLDRFLRLAKAAARRNCVPVFFFGPDERDMLEKAKDALPMALFPEEGLPAGMPSGPMLVSALGRRLSAAVANDSGLGHMLAVSSIPLVLLYGRHSPAKYAPRTPRLRTLWAQSFGGTSHEIIPYEAVEAELWHLLDEGAAEPRTTEPLTA